MDQDRGQTATQQLYIGTRGPLPWRRSSSGNQSVFFDLPAGSLHEPVHVHVCAHLRMKPPLMAICSRSSTTRAPGWLFTTPSWFPPQAWPPPLILAHTSSQSQCVCACVCVCVCVTMDMHKENNMNVLSSQLAVEAMC